MPERCAVINPGSSSWWLLTLTPVIYFDRLRVSASDLTSIHEQEGKSYYNLTTHRILTALENYAEDEFIIKDDNLPVRGRAPQIEKKVKKITDALLQYASQWSPKYPTLVRPSELKRIMTAAYKEWLAYNKSKASVTPQSDPFKRELLEQQIPRSQQSLKCLQSTPVREIVNLLMENQDFYIVFSNIIRNAYLICKIPDINSRERLYDVLVQEFLPAVPVVQRYLVFEELPEKTAEVIGYDTLIQVYDLRMHRTSASVSGVPGSPDSIVACALRERKRFALLRMRLAELDSLINNENQDIDEPWLREVVLLSRELHRQLEQIDKVGTAFMWASGAYFLREFLSTLEPSLSHLIRCLLVNPLTTKIAKDSMKNLYLATKGLKTGASPAIAAVRDYLGHRNLINESWSGSIGPGSYEFWV
jgi:hypothetical protein